MSTPSIARPLPWLVALLAGVLAFWGLTRNGYANTYYAEAAQAASHSWTALFTNALDVSGSDSLDKGPLSNMLMGLSGQLLGFSSFSMLLPEALCGIASVLLVHDIAKRTLGPRVAILAALMLALTPIFVAMSRFNNPDALLVLTEVGAAWALVRALESGRTRHMLLCGLFVGLAFNVKMLAAYLVVPGLALTFLVVGQGALRRRLAQLSAGGVAMLATSFAWFGTMMLLPAANRPWVGDTTDNSWFSLIFGANGLSRVSGSSGGGGGPGGGTGFGGSPGPLRMFNSIVGGQIAWLLPLALLGLLLGLWTLRRSPRTDLGRSAYLLWGGWGLLSWAVFSFSAGIFHPYYTTALAPPVAILAAAALVMLWNRSRGSVAFSAMLAAAMLGTVALAIVLLARATDFAPWLTPTLIALAALAVTAPALIGLRGSLSGTARRGLATLAVTAGLAAMLVGPASYSIATVSRPLTGSNPLAGPASAERGGFGGSPGGPPPGAPGGSFGGPPARGGAPMGRNGMPPIGMDIPGRGAGGVGKQLLEYLRTHQGNAKYLVAASGSSTAGQLALQSGKNVIDMGGFMGSDPAPGLARLKRLLASGELRYVLLGSGGGRGMRGPRGPGGSSGATRARDAWIRSHGRAVQLAGQSTAGTLYDLKGSL